MATHADGTSSARSADIGIAMRLPGQPGAVPLSRESGGVLSVSHTVPRGNGGTRGIGQPNWKGRRSETFEKGALGSDDGITWADGMAGDGTQAGYVPGAKNHRGNEEMRIDSCARGLEEGGGHRIVEFVGSARNGDSVWEKSPSSGGKSLVHNDEDD
ncbi:unnamed protein product [Lampetra fluviatilis]